MPDHTAPNWVALIDEIATFPIERRVAIGKLEPMSATERRICMVLGWFPVDMRLGFDASFYDELS